MSKRLGDYMVNRIDLSSLSIEEVNHLSEEIAKEMERREIDTWISSYTDKTAKLTCKVDTLNKRKAELREQLKDVIYQHYYAKYELDCALDYIKKLEISKENI